MSTTRRKAGQKSPRPAPDPRDRAIPLRSWEVLKRVPKLHLVPGDTVTEWVETHALSRYRGNTFARLPAGSWPAFLAAFVAGAVRVSRWTPQANPSDLLAEHGPERALELAWERWESYIIAQAGKKTPEVAW